MQADARPPGFVLTILMHDSDGTRKYCQVGDESRAGVAMRTAFDGRLPKRSQILAHDSREDPELQDYIARFAAGESLPIGRADGKSSFTTMEVKA